MTLNKRSYMASFISFAGFQQRAVSDSQGTDDPTAPPYAHAGEAHYCARFCYAECLEHRSSQSEAMSQIAMRMRQKVMHCRKQDANRQIGPECRSDIRRS